MSAPAAADMDLLDPVRSHARPSTHFHEEGAGCTPPPLWRRAVTVDAVILRRLGMAMIAIAGVLASSPIHPGTLCPLRATTGIPCPFCGMTTSVKESLRLDLHAAFAANPGGVVAVVSALVLVVWRPKSIRVPVALVALGGIAMWVFQLFRFSVL
ncbi:MAG: DUF2752 domain-containing protein [Actinomycetota bacterium]|nr:DUF2752 domain-containing protein [Actinomycetota bacterium]